MYKYKHTNRGEKYKLIMMVNTIIMIITIIRANRINLISIVTTPRSIIKNMIMIIISTISMSISMIRTGPTWSP